MIAMAVMVVMVFDFDQQQKQVQKPIAGEALVVRDLDEAENEVTRGIVSLMGKLVNEGT